jgi:hypothetical protein
MSHSSLTRLAGPLALSAGILMVSAQLVMLPFDPDAHVATASAPLFQLGGVVYMAGFVSLMLFVVASHGWQEAKSGRLGVVGTLTAAAGTMALGGDLWFETFAVPWLAAEAPNALSADPNTLLTFGAITSYLLFAVGWVLYGVASLRARVFPIAISTTIIIAGALGFQALLSPWGVPLGLAVGTLGIWMIRAKNTTNEVGDTPANESTAVTPKSA